MHILGQKEAIWNTIFSIFERRQGPQMSRGPGKLPPLDGPDHTQLYSMKVVAHTQH